MSARSKPSIWRRIWCWLGFHHPNWHHYTWGYCGESFVRECPHCGMRWYGDEITYRDRTGQEWRGVGNWLTRKQCIERKLWLKDKFPGQKF